MDLQLDNKTILVTAASRGLGYATAKVLADEGANVIICGRTEDSLKSAKTTIGGSTEYVVADVSRKDHIVSLIAKIQSISPALDGLFVNAGGPPPGTFSTISDEDWRHTFNLTLMSAVWLTRESLPLLRKSDSPSVLYSTSISVKQPIDNLLLSNSMRPAVIGMMRTLADEIGPECIRANAVCPGYIYTERVEELMAHSSDGEVSPKEKIESTIPLGRMGNPVEFGRVCAFLLSPAASYVHGALLLIDGGLYKGMM
ncbi:MAG: SDR family oxidoreductase [Candidatus Thorarchaeota archaeon]|nr:MAG: SDR family oxidoreductase [Candidatus Thorarchaeota archaeon]